MKWLTKSDIEASLPRLLLSHDDADFGTRGLRIDKVVPDISLQIARAEQLHVLHITGNMLAA
jgi:hypothetical protein